MSSSQGKALEANNSAHTVHPSAPRRSARVLQKKSNPTEQPATVLPKKTVKSKSVAAKRGLTGAATSAGCSNSTTTRNNDGAAQQQIQSIPVNSKEQPTKTTAVRKAKNPRIQTTVKLAPGQSEGTMGPPVQSPNVVDVVDLEPGNDAVFTSVSNSNGNIQQSQSDTTLGGSPANDDMDPDPDQIEILLTFESCSCAFCLDKLEVGEGIVLQDCCCSFCRACLTTVVENSSSAEVMCPLSSNCGGRLLQREIKALVPPGVYKRYIKRTESKIKAMMGNIFQCKTKGCKGCCEYQPDSKIFLCGECNKSNCLSCKSIHEGLECKDFQSLLANATKEGKSWEEVQEMMNSQLANGWEQVLGTVSTWMDNSPGMRVRSQRYSQILQKMTNQDLWLSTREFECPVCMSAIPVGDGIIIQDCLHCVCKECSIGLVEYATEPEIKCPYQDGNYSCTAFLKPREIKALVTPELHEIFLSRSVKQAESAIPNSFHCKTPDCHGWCEVEEGATVFKCYRCSKKNCLACEAIHENVTCEDYKNRLVQDANDQTSKEMLEEQIRKGECMRCPTCKIITMKISGCDWVVCQICKCQICWATRGPRWGPKGTGDTSGGCKCKADGKTLCVPNCQNCH